MTRLGVFLCLFLAGAAVAHQGVKNPAVQARMHNMGLIGGAMKNLGDMAKGQATFDAGVANAAIDTIRAEAAKTHGLFEANEDDPKSEARPEIWDNFADFASKVAALETAAQSVGPITTLDDVSSAMQALGATCSACHKAYRE